MPTSLPKGPPTAAGLAQDYLSGAEQLPPELAAMAQQIPPEEVEAYLSGAKQLPPFAQAMLPQLLAGRPEPAPAADLPPSDPTGSETPLHTPPTSDTQSHASLAAMLGGLSASADGPRSAAGLAELAPVMEVLLQVQGQDARVVENPEDLLNCEWPCALNPCVLPRRKMPLPASYFACVLDGKRGC